MLERLRQGRKKAQKRSNKRQVISCYKLQLLNSLIAARINLTASFCNNLITKWQDFTPLNSSNSLANVICKLKFRFIALYSVMSNFTSLSSVLMPLIFQDKNSCLRNRTSNFLLSVEAYTLLYHSVTSVRTGQIFVSYCQFYYVIVKHGLLH